jgi:hypothetical protein
METAIMGTTSVRGFAGSMEYPRKLFETGVSPVLDQTRLLRDDWRSRFDAARTGPTLRTLLTQQSASHQVFDAIQSLYLSDNRPRDREIAARITTLHRHALLEGEQILPASLVQFVDFFLSDAELRLPKITLTPDGALRSRWIRGPEDFVAIEFTGHTLVKLVIEVPRDGGQIASHFASEAIDRVVSVSRAIGASFT